MICDKLSEAKKRRGLTNQQLADLSGVPVTTVNRILAGTTENPGWQTVLDMATALEVPLAELVDSPTADGEEPAKQTETATPAVPLSQNPIYMMALQMVERERKEKRVLFLCFLVMVLFVVVLFSVDLLNPNVGWFRRALYYANAFLGDTL